MYNLSCDYALKVKEKNAEILKEASISGKSSKALLSHDHVSLWLGISGDKNTFVESPYFRILLWVGTLADYKSYWLICSPHPLNHALYSRNLADPLLIILASYNTHQSKWSGNQMTWNNNCSDSSQLCLCYLLYFNKQSQICPRLCTLMSQAAKARLILFRFESTDAKQF